MQFAQTFHLKNKKGLRAMSEIKNEHYIPQHFIKNFANDKHEIESFNIELYKKCNVNRAYSYSPASVLHKENNYECFFEKDGKKEYLIERNKVENFLGRLETGDGPFVRNIINKVLKVSSEKSLVLTSDEKKKLFQFLLQMVLRHPISKENAPYAFLELYPTNGVVDESELLQDGDFLLLVDYVYKSFLLEINCDTNASVVNTTDATFCFFRNQCDTYFWLPETPFIYITKKSMFVPLSSDVIVLVVDRKSLPICMRNKVFDVENPDFIYVINKLSLLNNTKYMYSKHFNEADIEILTKAIDETKKEKIDIIIPSFRKNKKSNEG